MVTDLQLILIVLWLGKREICVFTILELLQGTLEIGERRLLLQLAILVLAQLGQQFIPLLLEQSMLRLKRFRLLIGSNTKVKVVEKNIAC